MITAGGSNKSELKELVLNLAMWRFGVTLVRHVPDGISYGTMGGEEAEITVLRNLAV